MNGGSVVCENGLHFDQNYESNFSFNEKIFISHDSTFETNFKPQEMSLNDSFFTSLKKCVESIVFKGIIHQENHADVPLVSSHVVHI